MLFIAMCCSILAFSQTIDASKIKEHPRLLLLQDEEKLIRNNISKSPDWQKIHLAIITECNEILALPPVERKVIGRRLLAKSRESLRRIFFLSYAWRMTRELKYFRKCEEELLAVASFSDWNPSHFLDVGEMSLAVAIGYDWLYNDLSEASRKQISDALISKGIGPSLTENKDTWWLKGTNNWNQVCNTGVAFAAAAVYELQPQRSKEIIERSIKSIRLPMQVYSPDGNYPEGYSYWAYGTSYNVFMISMLETAFGSDYGLTGMPGFLKTPVYYEHMVGPSGKPFNYSDCGTGADGLQPAMLWFADKNNDPSLLWIEKQNVSKDRFLVKSNRLLPAAMVWGKNIDFEKVTRPTQRTWVGDGENPVALMHASWQSTWDLYVGFKGGTAGTSHAHMDIGSFVMDALGVRWSADLGMQGYEAMESKGLKIWDMVQNSDRWKVFRYNNFSHSTLTVNNALQHMKGRATIMKHSNDTTFMHAVMNLDEIYTGQLASARRGIAIVNKQYVTIRDEIETGDSACTIRWAMLTPASVADITKNQMLLQQQDGNKKLTFYVNGLPGDAVLKTWPTTPPNNYDEENPGTILVGFEITLPAHTKKEFNVFLMPGTKPIAVKKSSLKPLNEW
ncbi:heparinase II/III domain-containing protein [Filimonas effusa]|nr:heparinase II/III family protein [Filimonas effusa]